MCDNCGNCNYDCLAEIELDNGVTHIFEYNKDGFEFYIEEPFIIVKEDDEIIAMFNVNNVVSVIFD